MHVDKGRTPIVDEIVNVRDLHFECERIESITLRSSYVNIAIRSSLNRYGGLYPSGMYYVCMYFCIYFIYLCYVFIDIAGWIG